MADDLDDDIDDENDEDGEEQPKKKSLLKLGLFIGLPALIVILGGVAAFILLTGGDDEHAVAEGEHGEAAGHEEEHHEPEPLYTVILKDEDEQDVSFRVNIRSSDGRPMLMELQVGFDVADASLEPVIEDHLERIMDQYVTFLSELREDDLYGSAGSHRIRLELLRRVNLVIAPAQVEQVLILNMIVIP